MGGEQREGSKSRREVGVGLGNDKGWGAEAKWGQDSGERYAGSSMGIAYWAMPMDDLWMTSIPGSLQPPGYHGQAWSG